jgi:hypothetical protein
MNKEISSITANGPDDGREELFPDPPRFPYGPPSMDDFIIGEVGEDEAVRKKILEL